METETIELKAGDIYRWQYREPSDNDGAWGRYHCCSRIAIVEAGGRLRDTYWHGNEGRSFGAADLPKLSLVRLANMADLDRVRDYQADYYDDADLVNLNHSNSPRGNLYLRKGAKKSLRKMLAAAKGKLAQAESDERMAASRAERYRAAIAQIDAGNIDVML